MATYDITVNKPDPSTLIDGDILVCPVTKQEESMRLLPGIYKFELWGAKGGWGTWAERYSEPGQGGYTTGTLNLTDENTFYFHVGAQGNNGAYNGGAQPMYYGVCGGGATDVRLISGMWDNLDGLKSRILVAAGGGGTEWPNYGRGGHGGGITGETAPNRYLAGGGATQTSGGTSPNDSVYYGSFGMAAQGLTGGDRGGGGGGGWYGGGSTYYAGSGGGGSSFIAGYEGCDTTYAEYQGGYTFTDAEMQRGVHNDDGYLQITVLQIITQGDLKWFSRSNLEPKLIKAQITTPPTKVDYAVGEAFDPTGMVTVLSYSDGTTKTVTDWSKYDPFVVDWDAKRIPLYFYEKEYSAKDYITIGCKSYFDPGYYRIDVWQNGSSRGTSRSTTKDDIGTATPTHTGLRLLSNMSGANWSGNEPWGSPVNYYYAKTTIYMYAPEACNISATWYTDDQGSIYLNDTLLQTFGNCLNTTRTFNFVQGLNKLEIIWWEEGGTSACYFTNWHPENDEHFTYVGPYPKIQSSQRITTKWT